MPDDKVTAPDAWAHLRKHVLGTPVSLTDANIEECTDIEKVKKYYKLSGVVSLGGADPAVKRTEMEFLILGAMALRGL